MTHIGLDKKGDSQEKAALAQRHCPAWIQGTAQVRSKSNRKLGSPNFLVVFSFLIIVEMFLPSVLNYSEYFS